MNTEPETYQPEPTLIDLAAADRENSLILSVDGFEGPLDVLLILARTQKVDLMQISILALVEQYLEFVAEARKRELELAADYLVMAAWLAYLKSRLLLPQEDDDEEPSAEELAVRLQLRLQRLEAMRDAGAILMSRDRLGRDVHARGMPEAVKTTRSATYDVTLYELLKCYAEHRQRHSVTTLEIHRRPVYALEDALHRLGGLIQSSIEWTRLQEFLPADMLQKACESPQLRVFSPRALNLPVRAM